MYIDLQNNYICQCHHSIHQGIINKFNPNHDTNSLQFTKQLDISDRIKNHDLPMGFPDQFTGIWSYMTHYGSDQTLTSPTISLQSIPETPTIITINCTNNSNLKKLYNHDHEIIQYQPKLSRIVSHHSITKLKQGIWMGLYGIHGIEWIHSYHCPLQNMYIFTKLTGDLNVPRGTISFTFPPHSPTTSTYPELASATVYTGQGTIAMEGYQSPRHIPCQIFVMSESSLFVHWFGLDDSQDTWINEFKFYST
ncbi:hypothetical protein BC833DRAFT_598045 [Globomyces pollinis-pini]|nr:hypothetical protein BC833DRAFT_598045 [Globomyces pollinis-pini]